MSLELLHRPQFINVTSLRKIAEDMKQQRYTIHEILKRYLNYYLHKLSLLQKPANFSARGIFALEVIAFCELQDK